MKCLVTGATGFVGSQLCRQLADCEVSVAALSRKGSILADGSASHAIDLATQAVPESLLRGVDTVFHLAGIAHQSAAPDAYDALNYRASVSLARAAAAQGVKRFIYLSSVKAMGPATGQLPRAEVDCVVPSDPYGLSKWRSEQDLQAFAATTSMSIVVLRPCLVYGPKPKGNLASLAVAVRRGLPRPPDVGARSMIAVQDLADLMIKLALGPALRSATWIVSDGQEYSLRTVHDTLRRAQGKGPAASWLPLWAWRLGAYTADRVRRSTIESTYDKLFGTELYSNAALLQACDWRPTLELSDVVAQEGNVKPKMQPKVQQ